MNISHSNRSRARASVLLLTLFIITAIGVALVVALNLVNKQNYYVVRSQAWNACIPVIEAGIEEAMAHLNNPNDTNLTANGWRPAGNDQYSTFRKFGHSYYGVKITMTNLLQPVIVCTGYVRLPAQVDQKANGTLAQANLPPGLDLKRDYVARIVRVVAKKTPLHAKAMVAKERIDMKGNNITTDSFNSMDPNFSTPDGRYDPTKIRDNGDVATTLGLVDSIGVGNADIKGRVRTGPGGSVKVGSNGKVGSLAWHATVRSGIQKGWFSDDMNMSFPDVSLPANLLYTTPPTGSVNDVSYTYVLTNGNFVLPSLKMSTGEKLAVTGEAILWVRGDVSMSGDAGIYIIPPGTLKMYVAGYSAEIGGAGVNNTGRAGNFIFYGLPTHKDLSFHGNGEFTGSIYAPNAHLKMSGGGSGDQDFVGACVMNSISINGHYKFHFDEALGAFGPPGNYVIISWLEI